MAISGICFKYQHWISYLASGKGFITDETAFGPFSGTSAAAALLTGVTAMLFEWGIVKGNDRSLDSYQILKYLLRGVERNPAYTYPSQEWGLGTVNIYNTFVSLEGE